MQKRQQAEGQVGMWPFQNQQVWTRPIPAERASWCLTSAAFNDCFRAEFSHLTTFALTSQFGWRPEWSRYHLRPVSAGKAVITSSDIKKSYFYCVHQCKCSCYSPACKFMYVQTL